MSQSPFSALPEPIRDTRFRNPRLSMLGIDLIELSEMRARVGFDQFVRSERIDFNLLMVVTAGSGRHSVDFEALQVEPGTALLVRAGQVQQWHPHGDFEARLLLLESEVLPAFDTKEPGRDRFGLLDWHTVIELSADLRRDVELLLDLLGRDLSDFDGSDAAALVIRHQVLALWYRLGREQMRRARDRDGSHRGVLVFRDFTHLLEEAFPEQHSLSYYASRLGLSPSTISRACRSLRGQSAKAVIDQRIALEARRLLAHGDDSIAGVGDRLGFSEATNFVKFFRRVVGVTPAGFRRARRNHG